MSAIRRTIRWCVAATFGIFPCAALAQYAPGMDGRANDANNQVGSGGINAPIRQGFLNTGNLYVTGNVTGGRSFRGFSPISDPTSLRLALPTTAISSFSRDSVGLSQVTGSYQPGLTNPYFDPTRTVSGVAAIQSGLAVPGGTAPANPYSLPYSTLPGRGLVQSIDATQIGNGLDNVVPSSSIYTPYNLPLVQDLYNDPTHRLAGEALRDSPIFARSLVATDLDGQTGLGRNRYTRSPYASDDGDLLRRPTNPIERQPRSTAADGERLSSERMFTAARELVSPSQAAPRLFDHSLQEPRRDSLTGRVLPDASRLAAGADAVAVDPVSGLPRMQDAAGARDLLAATAAQTPATPQSRSLAVRTVPGTEISVQQLSDAMEYLATVGNKGTSATGADQPAESDAEYAQAMSIVESLPESELTTFATEDASRASELVIEAETRMREGKYYEAANRYKLAAAFDPDEPLIRFGNAHALLAAGEYISAVYELCRAIDAYPAVGFLHFDLNSFVSNPDILDIRRADLERRLSKEEDYRLRFLLGYTEYFSNLAKFGLPNLRKAAELAPEGSTIKKFPKLLDIAAKRIRPEDAPESTPDPSPQ